MLFKFSFVTSDLICSISDQGVEWHSPGVSEFINPSPSDRSVSDMSFLRAARPHMTLGRRLPGAARRRLLCQESEEIIARNEATGFWKKDCDLFAITFLRKSELNDRLEVSVFLSDTKHAHVSRLLEMSLGNRLNISFQGDFYGFRGEEFSHESLLRREEFYSGKPYLVCGDLRFNIGSRAI